jgi:hypothetical protein
LADQQILEKELKMEAESFLGEIDWKEKIK